MQRFNFATFITIVEERPFATHLPCVIIKRNDELVITSHFAKANEHWKHIHAENNLVIFSEPHAYVSPEHYNKKENVPTWNYLAIHAYGKGKVIEDKQGVLEVLEAMINNHEPKYQKQWDELPEKYKDGMLNGIVAFELEVNELQSKEKLSQNKKEEEQTRIINSFSKGSDMNEQMIAHYMKRNK